jgi:tRNA pseudouridine55 synthase
LTEGKSPKIPLAVESFPLFNTNNPPTPEYDFATGSVFLIDKPFSWTSFRVVGLLRKLTGIRKIGHAGTLDPMATGLLICCTGKATKSISLIQDGIKTYEAEVQFGASTPSYDAESEIDHTSDFSHITSDAITEKLDSVFTGELAQLPPMYSAIQVKGQRLYTLARKGITIEREPRNIVIHKNSLISYDKTNGIAKIKVVCGKGTYIRSLAHDLGLELGSHGHLIALRRTGSGAYSVNDALDVHQLTQHFQMHGKIDLS